MEKIKINQHVSTFSREMGLGGMEDISMKHASAQKRKNNAQSEINETQ